VGVEKKIQKIIIKINKTQLDKQYNLWQFTTHKKQSLQLKLKEKGRVLNASEIESKGNTQEQLCRIKESRIIMVSREINGFLWISSEWKLTLATHTFMVGRVHLKKHSAIMLGQNPHPV